jgi:tetratricopeptide (TPR) repeat protein
LLRGDYKAAIIEGERLVADEVHSDKLYYFLGLAYLKDGNYARASDMFELTKKEFKDSTLIDDARIGLGDTYLLRGDLEKAKDCYLEILSSNPNTRLRSQIYYRLSEVAIKEGDVLEGREYLLKLKNISDYNLEVRQGQSLCPIAYSGSGSFYSIQVGSFTKVSNASRLAKKLSADGYPVFIEENVSMDGKTYRVKVGKLKSRQEADALNDKLVREGYPTKICP